MIWPKQQIPKFGLLLLVSCVPSDPPAGATSEPDPVFVSAAKLQPWRPHPAAYSDPVNGWERAGRATKSDSARTEDPILATSFHDAFDRDRPGSDWTSTSDEWRIESGQLCGQLNHNRPIWMKRRIPTNARISFVARARSANADLKVEAWGNGRSFAKNASYTDATSYIFILGGWKNQLHVLARLNEHDNGRLELRIDPTSNDPRKKPVLANADYRFVIERRDGRTIVWRVNDIELFRFEDKEPLRGGLHDHFGFNNWESPVCFDDLTITPLPE